MSRNQVTCISKTLCNSTPSLRTSISLQQRWQIPINVLRMKRCQGSHNQDDNRNKSKHLTRHRHLRLKRFSRLNGHHKIRAKQRRFVITHHRDKTLKFFRRFRNAKRMTFVTRSLRSAKNVYLHGMEFSYQLV